MIQDQDTCICRSVKAGALIISLHVGKPVSEGPVLCIGKWTSYWLICDVGSNSSILDPRLWNTENPLWCFSSAPSLLGLHPISRLRLEISPGDLQLTVGSSYCKHLISSEFFMFSKEVDAGMGGCSVLLSAPIRECPPLLRWGSATHNEWKNLLGRLGGGKKFVLSKWLHVQLI